MKHIWLYITSKDLEIERQQLIDEGKDIREVDNEFKELIALLKLENDDTNLKEKVDALLDKMTHLPMRADYPYYEPSDLKNIQRARPDGPRKLNVNLSDEILYDRVLGAWLGRCSGCLLGKPVEGWSSSMMWGYLKDLGQCPLDNYFRSDIPDKIIQKYNIQPQRAFINQVDHMVEDDDINYTVANLAMMKQYGQDFTPENIATFWMQNIPILRTCTAERVAYKNFTQLISPPASAIFRNVYREWIGAQIRADFFGYAVLGNPELAAEFAWRDACISHIKNGIYGAMWVAAMLSVAPFIEDIEKVIQIGLSEIPEESRLTKNIKEVINWYEEGISYEEAITRIHKKWNEKSPYHWCHTISNAQIVTLGLLWGNGDFEKSICRAVQACFDTDCNGATVGSIIGMMLGAKKLPRKWIDPLNNKVETGVKGYHLVNISKLAKEGFKLYKIMRENK